jgi:Raf kinase inhibitor-like YbhB/YbcL family protein
MEDSQMTAERLRATRRWLTASALCAVLAAVSAGTPAAGRAGEAMTMKITSSAFEQGAKIPVKFTCDGPDLSPAIAWEGAPEGTRSFALIADDPDAPAGTWVHWVAYDLPASRRDLPEGLTTDAEMTGGGRHGRNDFRKLGYGGPCPPPGKPHRYFFRIYALDIVLGLEPGATKKQVLDAAEGHILAHAELMGTYGRQR